VIWRAVPESGRCWRMVTQARSWGCEDLMRWRVLSRSLGRVRSWNRRSGSSLEVIACDVGGAFAHSFGASSGWLGYVGERVSECSSEALGRPRCVRSSLKQWRERSYPLELNERRWTRMACGSIAATERYCAASGHLVEVCPIDAQSARWGGTTAPFHGGFYLSPLAGSSLFSCPFALT
jgi:hypothetical protein